MDNINIKMAHTIKVNGTIIKWKVQERFTMHKTKFYMKDHLKMIPIYKENFLMNMKKNQIGNSTIKTLGNQMITGIVMKVSFKKVYEKEMDFYDYQMVRLLNALLRRTKLMGWVHSQKWMVQK